MAIYNFKVRNAIKSISLQAESSVIKENGRHDNEIGFALILNGRYKGFGYIDKDLDSQLSSPEDYQFYLTPKKDNKDIQNILAAYFRKTAAANNNTHEEARRLSILFNSQERQ